jgi:hypothetical protein
VKLLGRTRTQGEIIARCKWIVTPLAKQQREDVEPENKGFSNSISPFGQFDDLF